MSAEEFLVWEPQQEGKHQFIDGEIYAMAGGTMRHAYLASQATHVLNLQRAGGCKVFGSELMIQIPTTGNYVYPDASMICGPIEAREESHRRVALNPCLIVEVLSDSTEAHDRGGKWRNYQSIETLQDYLLVSQEERRVEHFARDTSGGWRYRVYTESDVITLQGATIALDELYGEAFDIPA